MSYGFAWHKIHTDLRLPILLVGALIFLSPAFFFPLGGWEAFWRVFWLPFGCVLLFWVTASALALKGYSGRLVFMMFMMLMVVLYGLYSSIFVLAFLSGGGRL